MSSENTVDHIDLRAAVGTLIFICSDLEADLVRAIAEMEPDDQPMPHGIKRSIDRWRSLHARACAARSDHKRVVETIHAALTDSLQVRNGICHGLKAWRWDPTGAAGDTGIDFELNGQFRTVTFPELARLLDRTSALGGHISRMTFAAKNTEKPGIESLYVDVENLMTKKAERPQV